MTPAPVPQLLSRRLGVAAPARQADQTLRLALTAEERTRLRGHRLSVCGRALLLQLPRGEALQPGEWLADADGVALVQVEPAAEDLLAVRTGHSRGLLQAAYHLGNRHVALEIHADELRLLVDPVLEQLLLQRGLQVSRCRGPFLPEMGAYSPAHHPTASDTAAGHGHPHP